MKQKTKFQKKSSNIPSKQNFRKENLETKPGKKILVWLIIISIVTIIVYSPAFKNSITNWDDDSYVIKNPWLQELSSDNLKSIFSEYYMGNYHPLAMLSLSIDFQIGGFNKEGEIDPFIYHFTNILLHLINTILVFWLIYILLAKFEIAVITSLLFGVGTLHVESVAWISERKDVLYAMFFIASLIAWVYYIKQRKLKYYIYSLILFLLSLFSKGQAVSLAVTLFIIDYLFDRKILDKKVLIEKIPFLALAFIFGIIAIKAQQEGNALHDSDSYAFYKRIGFAGYAFSQYLIKLTVPVGLSAIYPYPDIINKIIPAYYWLFMIPSLLVGYTFFYYLKRNKIIAFCIGFFIINIFLLLQLIPVGSAILADRYSYIPSIGFHLLMAFLIFKLIEKNTLNLKLVYGITAIYLIGLGIASFERCKIWKDSMTLWNDTLEKSPKAVVAWNNRGSIKDRDKDHKGAIEDFTEAIALKPDYSHAFYNRGTSKKDWASELKDSILLRSALIDFDRAIALDPVFVEAFHNRGLTFENLSEYTLKETERKELLNLALNDYNTTIDLNPAYENALVNRGVIKGKMGNYTGAVDDFNKAIEMTPDNASAYSNRGLAKDRTGDTQGAIKDYTTAIEKDKDFVTAYLNRGIVYWRMKNHTASINDLSKAISLNDKLTDAYYYRALSLLDIKKKNEACTDLQKATELGNYYASIEFQKTCAVKKGSEPSKILNKHDSNQEKKLNVDTKK